MIKTVFTLIVCLSFGYNALAQKFTKAEQDSLFAKEKYYYFNSGLPNRDLWTPTIFKYTTHGEYFDTWKYVSEKYGFTVIHTGCFAQEWYDEHNTKVMLKVDPLGTFNDEMHRLNYQQAIAWTGFVDSILPDHKEWYLQSASKLKMNEQPVVETQYMPNEFYKLEMFFSGNQPYLIATYSFKNEKWVVNFYSDLFEINDPVTSRKFYRHTDLLPGSER